MQIIGLQLCWQEGEMNFYFQINTTWKVEILLL
jgi:hypothetical protein